MFNQLINLLCRRIPEMFGFCSETPDFPKEYEKDTQYLILEEGVWVQYKELPEGMSVGSKPCVIDVRGHTKQKYPDWTCKHPWI